MNKEGCKGVIKSRMRVLTLYRNDEKGRKGEGRERRRNDGIEGRRKEVSVFE